MGYDAVVQYFKENHITNEILLFEESSATVELAAQRLSCQPGEIAKTLAVRQHDKDLGRDSYAVLVLCGTAKIDNRKYKDTFHCKAQMLGFDETLKVTGHPVGGVCPFGLPPEVKIYLDQSLRQFGHVYPAAGTANSAVKFEVEKLADATGGSWVDVAKTSQEKSEDGKVEGK